jgi:hypothetical protein
MTKAQLCIKAKNLVLLVTKYNLSTGEALELQKTAGSLHRLYEAACNYELTPRQETRQHNLYRKAVDLAYGGAGRAGNGFFIKEQRDPRGWPLDISLEPHNDSTQYDQVCPF